jgi:tetratricopeptide (TPR) repeat protein
MGQAYGAIKHYQKAIENYHLAMETGSDLDEDILQICVVELAAAYKRIGREEDAVLLIQENTELVTNDNFTSEHGFAILRNGVTIEDLPEVIFEIASHNVDDYDGFILVSYKLIIELYNMFGLDELANPYIEKYTQLRRENMLASGF